MAYFAEVDAGGSVLRVIVIPDEHAADGANWCRNLLRGIWMLTSYAGDTRKNYAGIGFKYDAGRDAFIAPPPYASWVLDEAKCRWDAPIPHPTDGKLYDWDEATRAWVTPKRSTGAEV